MLNYSKVIFIGDSLTELSFDPTIFGLGSALSHHFRRRADVYNRGLSGYNSVWLEDQIDRICLEFEDSASQVVLIILWLGTNDSVIPGNPHHVLESEFLTNLKKYTAKLLSTFPEANLLLLTPAPINMTQLQVSTLSDSGKARTPELALQYAQIVVRFFREQCQPDPHVKCIDLYNLLGSGKDDDFYVDGVHLNSAGYREVWNAVHQELVGWVELPLIEPHWTVKAGEQKLGEDHTG
ncbi:Isoamyl acetate-hydrolyzing esterase 1 [Yarrowia lipolytica]|nr:Isoamyl acetate-hydrolyzing esterase 1 [Yarrowia lipolytica]